MYAYAGSCRAVNYEQYYLTEKALAFLEKLGFNDMRAVWVNLNNNVYTINFAPDSNAPFGKSADLFDDATVFAYLTPTHSAGSVIYKIVDGNKFALIVGDNGYMQDSWLQGLLPGPLYNADNMRKCLAWIKEQSLNPDCLGIFCAHDTRMLNI